MAGNKAIYFLARSYCAALNVLTGKELRNDMYDHLPTLAFECDKSKPKLIVELGTRSGWSTRTLVECAKRNGATMLSVDIEDCSRAVEYEKWFFVRSDDVVFAAQFPDWCGRHGIEPKIDFFFVDTSHVYEHTVREIDAWFPHLSQHCRAAFHDTNMGYICRMRHGRRMSSRSNQRGVILPIEEYLGIKINEKKPALLYSNGWKIVHDPFCSGMTVLER